MTKWKDSLPEPEDMWAKCSDLTAAAYYLTLALANLEYDPIALKSTNLSDHQASVAAAFIRRFRKSLEVPSQREDDFYQTDKELILWSVMNYVSIAARSSEPVWQARLMRISEAALRTLWRQQQIEASPCTCGRVVLTPEEDGVEANGVLHTFDGCDPISVRCWCGATTISAAQSLRHDTVTIEHHVDNPCLVIPEDDDV